MLDELMAEKSGYWERIVCVWAWLPENILTIDWELESAASLHQAVSSYILLLAGALYSPCCLRYSLHYMLCTSRLLMLFLHFTFGWRNYSGDKGVKLFFLLSSAIDMGHVIPRRLVTSTASVVKARLRVQLHKKIEKIFRRCFFLMIFVVLQMVSCIQRQWRTSTLETHWSSRAREWFARNSSTPSGWMVSELWPAPSMSCTECLC